MGKHLTLEDRIEIEIGIKQHSSIKEISEKIGKNRTTVAREIQKYRNSFCKPGGNDCIHRNECNLPEECRNLKQCPSRKKVCRYRCRGCTYGCENYIRETCPKLDKAPYVCNGCSTYKNCTYLKMEYRAELAHKKSQELRSESRKGISLTEKELIYLDGIITPAIKKGQSIPIICSNHFDEIPVSYRTIYSYIDARILNVSNIDLRRKVRRKPRKKSGPVLKVDRKCHIGRTYEDYKKYLETHPDVVVVQMDSVIGERGGKVLLTILFTNCDLQLMYIRDHNNAASVTQIFRELRKKLGKERFEKLFQVLLTDRGSEFTDPAAIEYINGAEERTCRVFYCDPMNSNQKSNCERNHEMIRYVIPKGTSMDGYDQNDIKKMENHINSYGRKKWNGQAPIDLFIQIYGRETANLLGLEKVPADSVNLTPSLFK